VIDQQDIGYAVPLELKACSKAGLASTDNHDIINMLT